MENVTIGQVWLVISGILGAIYLILNVVERISKSYKAARAPEEEQNRRIYALETEVVDINRKLDKDFARLNEQTESSRLSQEALLALLDHNISGNNMEQMQAAKDKLRQHLINHS